MYLSLSLYIYIYIYIYVYTYIHIHTTKVVPTVVFQQYSANLSEELPV